MTSWRPQREFSHPHFPGQQTEAQRREATYARSQDLAEAGFEARGSDCGGCVPSLSPRQKHLPLPALRCPAFAANTLAAEPLFLGKKGCFSGEGAGKAQAGAKVKGQLLRTNRKCRGAAPRPCFHFLSQECLLFLPPGQFCFVLPNSTQTLSLKPFLASQRCADHPFPSSLPSPASPV